MVKLKFILGDIYHMQGEPEVRIVNHAGAGTHVLGIEPANCHVGGRSKEREQGSLVFLEPGETVKYSLRLNCSILDHLN